MKSEDISALLAHWPFRPGEHQARLVSLPDGEQAIQMRVDLGVLQMRADGRPDGLRPFDRESLLEYQKHLRAHFRTRGEGQGSFSVGRRDAVLLAQELAQYACRASAFYALKNLDKAVRDARHALEIVELIEQARPPVVGGLLRIQVTALHARASAERHLERKEYGQARETLDAGLARLEAMGAEGLDMAARALSEVRRVLHTLQARLEEYEPVPLKDRLSQSLRQAVAAERYEEAARLRDELARLRDAAPMGEPPA